MDDETSAEGLRARITRQGEDALGKLAQELLENPLVTGALTRAFDAREKAAQAQELAMGALNLPSASDLERLTRRLRSLGQRLEGIEEGLDRLDERIERLGSSTAIEQRLIALEADIERLGSRIEQGAPDPDALERRLRGVEKQLTAVGRDVGKLAARPDSGARRRTTGASAKPASASKPAGASARRTN